MQSPFVPVFLECGDGVHDDDTESPNTYGRIDSKPMLVERLGNGHTLDMLLDTNSD